MIVILSLVIIGLLGNLIRIRRYTLATGYVTTEHYAEVRPAVTGVVSRILASSGDKVQAGQVLVELNAEEEATLAEVKTKLSRLQTEITRRKAEMDIDLERRALDISEQRRLHQDQLAMAELQLQNASAKLKLTTELVEKGLKAASYLEDDKLNEKLAQVTLQSLQNKDFAVYDELLERDREKYGREIEALNQDMEGLQDAVRQALARVEARKIKAPIDGMVVRYEFVVGELLQPSHVIYEIFGGEKQVLKLRVSEKHATKIAVGQPYEAQLASYRGLSRIRFEGQVEGLRNVIQTQGETSYRVAYCSFDAGGREIPPGTTAEARIYYGKTSFWLYLFNMDL